MTWLIQNLATILTSIVLLIGAGAAIRYLHKSSKAGTCAGCGGNCAGCSHCSSTAVKQKR